MLTCVDDGNGIRPWMAFTTCKLKKHVLVNILLHYIYLTCILLITRAANIQNHL